VWWLGVKDLSRIHTYLLFRDEGLGEVEMKKKGSRMKALFDTLKLPRRYM
jgi:hypothetical protein